MRRLLSLSVAAPVLSALTLAACSIEYVGTLRPGPLPDGGARPDAAAPTDGASDDAGEDTAPELPDAIEDTASDDVVLPPPGSRIEGTIGAAGGTLTGVAGTPLAGVVLAVPAGALASDVHFAIDLAGAPVAPGGGTLISPYVKVGPEGVAFASPARLTLPYSSITGSRQVAAVARIGFSWSSLLDPVGDAAAKTVTASMGRTSGAALVELDLSSVAPKITAFAPSSGAPGTTVFVEGSGFGIAPVWRPSDDGGAPFVSTVKVGDTIAEPIGWTPDAIAIRVPAGDGGTISVVTPGGTATSSGTLAVP